MKGLHKLALVLEVAEELHRDGKLDDADFARLVEGVEETFKNPNKFKNELAKWAVDLLSMDKMENHLQNLQHLVNAFMESPEADDHQKRVEILQLTNKLALLLSGIAGYDQREILFRFTQRD
ncbi:hypothetical protein [Maribacter flavus]|uniref:Uncharacterized protein n=1 Tax=Maribacter flavus TaxID=1658664 RepID=A0A5B2TX88_9FLAO|nr:hypothetical protein [Maribacter flavus]KAA2218240.1 hypothetical protein F0361_01070 [Maribacter flavus]